jgi:hypothetical protein
MLLAARYGHKSIVETFLNVGENIDIQILCDSRYTALHCIKHANSNSNRRMPSWLP